MKIGLWGYGKMGRAIHRLIENDPAFRYYSVQLCLDRAEGDQVSDETLQQCDVIIEFTTPSSAYDNLYRCLRAAVPVVSGTTGWLDKWPHLVAYCESAGGSLFYASNFSLGVHILSGLNKKLAQWMAPFTEYDVGVEEAHHVHKKDAPSGTAIQLAEEIIQRLPSKSQWVKGMASSPPELSILSERKNEIPGTHHVVYKSVIDSIKITHEAHSREGFAKGALRAAAFIAGKKGVYGMNDLLPLE